MKSTRRGLTEAADSRLARGQPPLLAFGRDSKTGRAVGELVVLREVSGWSGLGCRPPGMLELGYVDMGHTIMALGGAACLASSG